MRLFSVLCLIAVMVPLINARPKKRAMEASNIRQEEYDQLTPELKEFKDEMLAALEIPEAVKILYDLFAFLATPLEVSIEAVEAIVEATDPDKQLDANDDGINDAAVKDAVVKDGKSVEGRFDVDRSEQARQLSEIEEEVAPLESPTVLLDAISTSGFVDSVLSMAELVEASKPVEDAHHIDENDENEGDTVAARIRRLRMLNTVRERTGEVVGDLLYGKQSTVSKLWTPKRGPIETVIYGRGPPPLVGRRGILG